MSVFNSVETDELYIYDNKFTTNDLLMVDKNKKIISSTINVDELNVLKQLSSTALDKIQLVKGDKGDTGLQGIQGVKGVKGDTGSKGDTGTTGKDGVIDYSMFSNELDETRNTIMHKINTDYFNPLLTSYLPENYYNQIEVKNLITNATLSGPAGKDGIQGIQGIKGVDGIKGLK